MPGMDLLVIYANKQVMEFYIERIDAHKSILLDRKKPVITPCPAYQLF